MHAIASLLPHLSDGIQNYALCALLLSFHNVEKVILNSHSDFIYTANGMTIKTTGTGKSGAPAGKVCTIYGKGL